MNKAEQRAKYASHEFRSQLRIFLFPLEAFIWIMIIFFTKYNVNA